MSEQPQPTEEINALDPSSVIIIHPGSLYLRLGRASDPNPKKMLHAIARRRKIEKFKHSDPLIVNKNPDVNLAIVENCRQKLIQQLQKSIRSDGRKRVVPPGKKIAELNASQKPHIVSDHLEEPWYETKSDTVIGDDVLRLHPDESFNLHFPYKRGDFNLHDGVGGSLTGVLADLELIWTVALQTLLGLTKQDLSSMKAVVVIPALYKRPYVKHYMTLILTQIGFGQAFLLQDHVAATFGAGLGFACVIDVGDQKASISCVEDGISHPDTRIHLDFGGSDISQVFYYLMEQIEFPYQNCQPMKRITDAQLLEKLKIENCHFDLDICGTAEETFLVSSPGSNEAFRYTVYLSDECIIAPMALFHPELLEISRAPKENGVKYMGKNQGDPEDPHDNIYLSETSRKYTKAGDTSVGDISIQGCDPDTSQNIDDELDVINEDIVKRGGTANNDTDDKERSLLMPIDQAILKSIEACPSDEMKKKMYSSILIVGGGMKFRNADKFLMQKLALQIPPVFRQDPMEVQINAKSISSDETTWKGAAILSCLGSAQDLWIGPQEWTKSGQKLLREKAPFPWA